MAVNTRLLFNHGMRYSEENDCYTFQMVYKRNYWWLLLLLLPLLLFIRCEKDVTIHCFEKKNCISLSQVPVELRYKAHFLYCDGSFFADSCIQLQQVTDTDGKVVFKDLPCSVYSYFFYSLSKMSISAIDDCNESVEKQYLFHWKSSVKLPMVPRRENLNVKLVDSETDDPLIDATLWYRYRDGEQQVIDSAQTDASGIAVIPKMRYCGVINEISGRCYGYADTTKTEIPCADLIIPQESQTIRLRPIKKRFTFFVKNKETKEPIPEATCSVVLTRPSGNNTQTRTLMTSIDGKGIAAYDDAFILATIEVLVKKSHFKHGQLEGGPWVVDKFFTQSDNIRTIWLEPEPYLVEYIDVDSINGKPIPGVRNDIEITDPAGKVERLTEISNRNGVFPVKAKAGSKIEIISTKDASYKKKRTIIANFRDKEFIPLEPICSDVKLRTVIDKAGYPLLPQCNLNIKGSISGKLQPTDSGSGLFKVRARINEKISIEASKSGFSTNSSTVRDTPMSDLKHGRDIPLKADPVVYNYSKAVSGVSQECYDLQEGPAKFEFTWSTCSACTMVSVIDGNGKSISQFGIDSPSGDGVGIRYSDSSGSTVLYSPTQSICVVVQNINTHTCTYSIRVIQ